MHLEIGACSPSDSCACLSGFRGTYVSLDLDFSNLWADRSRFCF